MLLSEAARKSRYPRTKIKIVNLTDSAPWFAQTVQEFQLHLQTLVDSFL